MLSIFIVTDAHCSPPPPPPPPLPVTGLMTLVTTC